MITRENKQLQALAMIDGALAKRMLAKQLWEESKKEFVQARQILDDIAGEADGTEAAHGA
jgi:hypothetical protein